MTTQEKVDLLRKDFLRREGRNYTSASREGRLGWEKGLSGGDAYSSMMVAPKDDADLHRIAYNHAREIVIAMNTPFKVKIALTPNSSCTDGRTVSVATDVFDDRTLTPGQKVDIFTGLAVHEGSHLLYTDFSVPDQAENRTIAMLHNIIEDERIETLTGRERPGLANFLGCAKYYFFDRHSSRMKKRTGKGLPKTARLLNAIISMIRYPESMDETDAAEFADSLLEVRDIILPFPETCEGALEKARDIYAVIRKFFEQEKKEQNKSQKPEGKDSQKKNESSRQNGEEPQGGSPSNTIDSGEDPEPKMTHSQKRRLAREIEESLEETLESLEQDVVRTPSDGRGRSQMSPDRMSAEIRSANCRLGKALAGELEYGKMGNVNIRRPKPDKDSYFASLERVRRHIPAMSGILRSNGSDRSLELRGLRSGSLDTGKLAEAVQGVESIYRRETTVRADRMAVCVLVDESGSMEGEKIEAARDTAVLLNEALAPVRNVDLYIYGHTTESGSFVKLNVYKEGNSSKFDRYVLGSLEANYSNVDSKAIREAAARVRARTRDRCLFIVISDGAPCEPESNVRNAVRDLTRDGFTVVSIGIDFEYDPSTMYENHVNMTDLTRLAPDLGRMIKKAIMKNSKR